mmetsp:Transcript_28333/g.74980  ORF Transcript_28333/g.74980 Transcript_28333/m.74980 type:complete len:753 (-) Transcript_28333:12-2270(-)
MKCAPMTTLLGLLLILTPCVAISAVGKAAGSRTITQVVELLQGMMEKSKADGNTERELFAKFKCYCDINTAEKTSEIESLTEEITVLESKIEALQASTGTLSEEVAKLKADIEANEASQTAALNLRTSRNGAFVALRTDLLQAIDQMNQAISTLAAIGADQTSGQAAADHKFMMAGHDSLLSKKLRTSVKQALLAASAFVTDSTHMKQTQVLESFLQAPFTGTYTAQSGEVVGILKDMRDTFKANLASARTAEASSKAAYLQLKATLEKAWGEMNDSHSLKQSKLSGNDATLASKKSQLTIAEQTKADDETFLAELTELCDTKAAEYKNRVMMRTNEEAAIAEAISILNSDAAFATFGGVSATGAEGATSFVQAKSIRRHVQAAPDVRTQVRAFLAPKAQGDARLSKVVALLEASNPFAVVLAEIKKMLNILVEEGTADQNQHDWCVDERTKNEAEKLRQEGIKNGLVSAITQLKDEIENPDTGLKVSIERTTTGLEENDLAQKSETADRTEDNLAYQKDVANLVAAEAILEKAIKVLDAYYSQLEGAFLQKNGDDPAPPSTWKEGAYEGRKTEGGGAIDMLKFILSETQKEELTAHDDERKGQHDFEDSMTLLTAEEATLRKSLAEDQLTLANTEVALMAAEKELAAAEKEIKAIEDYLLKIKPGCDFIVAELNNRIAARVDESAALTKAEGLIKATPAYQTAVTEKHEEDLGECKDICNADGVEQATCKACLAKTSVPGYCAGHPGTAGC